MENNETRAWKLMERGREYNNRLIPNQYRTVETNREFFIGNQWLNLPDTPAVKMATGPVFNIIKRVASLFIASLTSSAVTVRVEPLAYYGGRLMDDPDRTASDFANAELANLLEKLKFEYRLRDALFSGATDGDYCAHFWFDPDARPYGGAFGDHRGEIRMELVDGINVMFGDPSDPNTEHQPYILLVGRDTVENLRQEARAFRRNRQNRENRQNRRDQQNRENREDRETGRNGGTVRKNRTIETDETQNYSAYMDADGIQPDSDTTEFPGVGGQTELMDDGDGGGRALYVLLYTKHQTKDGRTSVHVTKATRTGVIYEDVDTGLSVYPVAWGNWERQKNQYHGRALVTGIIPNQIFINQMMADAMRTLRQMAWPKVIYNKELIPVWLGEPGKAIGVRGPALMNGTVNPAQLASVLPPVPVNGQIFTLIDKVMDYTKECLGATDAQMGNVKPDNTSALMVLQTNAEVPLENIRAGLHEWTEDVARILLDMMGTYYGRRPVVMEREFQDLSPGPGGIPAIGPDGMMVTQTVRRSVVEEFDFSILKDLWLNLRVDVGATTYFSEIAITQTLDNLRREGTLDVIQYLERVPDKLIPRKDELLDELKKSAGANPAGGTGMGSPGGTGSPGGMGGMGSMGSGVGANMGGRARVNPTGGTRGNPTGRTRGNLTGRTGGNLAGGITGGVQRTLQAVPQRMADIAYRNAARRL